ncbi:MAG TPA: hypothetical protein VI731_11365, partial [Bacteroidia bacterium]|nr:hypothetical protein [Bacteroidia bacterium]
MIYEVCVTIREVEFTKTLLKFERGSNHNKIPQNRMAQMYQLCVLKLLSDHTAAFVFFYFPGG